MEMKRRVAVKRHPLPDPGWARMVYWDGLVGWYTGRMLTMKICHYRLYPTKEQQRLLARQLEECRWLWNTLLAERKRAWEDARRRWTTTRRRQRCPASRRESVHP
jgi:hypothetical protein